MDTAGTIWIPRFKDGLGHAFGAWVGIPTLASYYLFWDGYAWTGSEEKIYKWHYQDYGIWII